MVSKIEKIANEVGNILIDNFDTHKYDSRFTLWGVSYLWISDMMTNLPVSENRILIPAILETAENLDLKIIEPDYSIPRSRSAILHFSMMCLANRDLIEMIYSRTIQPEISDEVMSIITDEKLLNEAMQGYVELKDVKKIDKDIDFFDYLLRHDVHQNRFEQNPRKTTGTYVPLAERLVYRYGEENIEKEIFKLVKDEISQRAKEKHIASSPLKTQTTGENVRTLYEDVVGEYHDLIVGENRCAEEVLNDKEGEEKEGKEKSAPEKITGVKIPGKRRVRVNKHTYSLNWESILKDRHDKVVLAKAIDLDRILKARIRNNLLAYYEKVYEVSPEQAHGELQDKIKDARNEDEREVFKEVYEMFVLVGKYDQIKSINHEMPISKKRKH